MSEILISKNNLKVLEDAKVVGFGEESICYYMSDEKNIIKVYRENKKPQEIKYVSKESPYIAFPKDIYKDLDTKEILAITMPFLPGEKLENGFPNDVNLNNLEMAYNVLCQELEKFGDIYMVDMCLDNILYDTLTNSFYLIDTGRWHDLPDVSGLNRARIDLNLSAALTNNLSWLKDYPNLLEENPKLHSFYINSRDARYTPFLEYLNLIKSFVLEKYGIIAENLSDLELKNIKKT